MAITFVQALGRQANKVSQTSTSVGPQTTTAGNLIVVAIALDVNTTVLSVVDQAGNVYTRSASVTNGSGLSGLRVEVWAVRASLGMTAQNYVVTYGEAVVSKGIAAWEFAGADNTLDGVGSAIGSSTTPLVTLTPVQPDDLLIGIIGIEGPNTDAAGIADSDSIGGDTWHGHFGASNSGAPDDSNICLGWQAPSDTVDHKITTSAAPQTYSPTLGVSRPWAALLVAFSVILPAQTNWSLDDVPLGLTTDGPSAPEGVWA